MIQIGEYSFEGPFTSTASLLDSSGIYAILSDNGPNYKVLDIGESATVRTRVETHDRTACWRRSAAGKICVAVLYTPHLQSSGRVAIEHTLRLKFTPPCGIR
jgi:hypothetical protein